MLHSYIYQKGIFYEIEKMNICEYLKKHGISQKWFASQLGLAPSYICSICKGRKKMPKKYWTKVIFLTKGEVSLEDLLGLKEIYAEFTSHARRMEN